MTSDLAARVEAATGADRELDAAIFRLLGWLPIDNPTHAGGLVGRWTRGGVMSGHSGPPDYTRSVDAALMLVPDGYFARIYCEAPQAIIVAWTDTVGWEEVCRSALCSTPALALTAAALRAHLLENDDGR